MADEVKVNPSEASHDAQLLADNVAEGVEKAPEVDIDADYELAKELSVAPIDNTEEGKKAAEAAVAPERPIPQATEPKKVEVPATGNPDDYKRMASEIEADDKAGSSQAVTSVDDNLVEKALEMGQPGQ